MSIQDAILKVSTADGACSKVTSTLRQIRHGSPTAQRSDYTTFKYAPIGADHRGKGTDILFPIVDANGAVQAYLLYSTYSGNRVNALDVVKKAMATWKAAAENLAAQVAECNKKMPASPSPAGR